MCGRYGFSIPIPEALAERFSTENQLEGLVSRYNAAPGQALPVITKHSPNQARLMTWGLIPFWAKDDKMRYTTINARAEGIEAKPAYRRPLRSQRCLVPASGFYEWDKSVKPSIPNYFTVVDAPLFAFAGLYDTWQDPATGQTIQTYTIITTSANDLVAPVHNRMPVILSQADEELWLDPDETEPLHLLPLLKPYPADKMAVHHVSRDVNNVKNDAPHLVETV